MTTSNRKIDVIFPDSVLPYVKMQGNNDLYIYENPPYIEVADDFLSQLQPKTCLELGAGLGRMSLYFYKRFHWQNTRFYLQDGMGEQQYIGIRHANENEFYNNFAATACFCKANGLTDFVTLHDIQTLPEKIDFVYSFAAIGFHWHIQLYLDKILPYLNPNARLLFEMRAPKGTEELDVAIREEYQSFYDAQLNYAKTHPAYQVLDVVDLRHYQGYPYKNKTHFLIMSPKKNAV